MGLIPALLAMLCAISPTALAEGIPRWRTPSGALHFGSRPPPGSRLLGTVESLGTSGGGPAAAAPSSGDAADGARIRAERARRRAERRALAEKLRGAARIENWVVTRGALHWHVAGTIRNVAPVAIHDVSIVVGGVRAAAVPPVIPPGGESRFELQVESFPLGADDVLPPPALEWREMHG